MGCCLGEDANLAAAPLAQSLFFRPRVFRPRERRPPMERRRHIISVEALVPPDATRGAAHSATRSNSVHEWPKTAPRGRFRRSVYTPESPRLSTTAQQCTQMAKNCVERPFSPTCVHSCIPTACSRDPHVATVYTNGKKRCREAILADLCTLLRPHVCPQRCNSVHKWSETAPRGYFSQSVYTLCLRGQADPAGSAWTPTRTTDSCVQGRTAPVWERPPR